MIIRSKHKKRFEIEIGASHTGVFYAKTLRGVLWHLSRANGRVAVTDRQTDVQIFLGNPRQGYDLIKTLLENYGGNESLVMDVFIANSMSLRS